MPAQHKNAHPWSREGYYARRVAQTRTTTFNEFVATRPKREAQAIRDAELEHLDHALDTGSVQYAAWRDFQEIMADFTSKETETDE